MTELSSKGLLSGFANYLAENKLLDAKHAIDALEQATAHKKSYINYLIKHRLLSDGQVATAVSAYFGLPYFDLDALNIDLVPTQFLNIELVRKRLALPLFIKKSSLYVAVSDPTAENLYEIRFLTGLDIRLLIVEQHKLEVTVDERLNTVIFSGIDSESEDTIDTFKLDGDNEEFELENYDVNSAPIVNYVNKILLDAIEKGASDIHFEHYESDFRIRVRINGTLYPVSPPPLKIATFILARIKVMSNLDITEHRVPQDGRFKINVSKNRVVDFRVSICPTLVSEKVVLRILDPTQVYLDIDKLGLNEIEHQRLVDALNHSQGMILVTGPTGSGKTITLYSSLNYLNSNDVNISAVEDPVEITLYGINQVHVNPKVGLTFATALRAFLRQDPDIIMVGEIRDLETAEIAVKAAQTGHLVLSTLHTNSAPETIIRLMNMGIEHYNIASSLILVIAQRLIRVLCNQCKQIEKIPDEVLLREGFKKEEIGTFQLYKAVGCVHCTQGYTGRTAIFEIMPISKEMSYLIMRGGNSLEITELAKKENVTTLREAGLEKVKKGITSLVELNRTFK